MCLFKWMHFDHHESSVTRVLPCNFGHESCLSVCNLLNMSVVFRAPGYSDLYVWQHSADDPLPCLSTCRSDDVRCPGTVFHPHVPSILTHSFQEKQQRALHGCINSEKVTTGYMSLDLLWLTAGQTNLPACCSLLFYWWITSRSWST